MKIAIVNDMPMAIEGLRRVVENAGIHQVAWIAFNGYEAIEACRRDVPDLVLMDIIMPGINGVETTREIMRESPCPILLVTSSVNTNSALVFEAMGYGALDAVNTPVLVGGNACDPQSPLLKKIAMLNILTQPVPPGFHSHVTVAQSKKSPLTSGSLIAIGSSSGGPQALATILQSIPGDFHSPIVIVQHVDAQFVSGLAEWLNTLSNIPVRIACDGDRPVAGVVFLAGSNDHLLLAEDGTFRYSPIPRDTPYRPSVDVFWQSLEQHWKGNITVVLLTGMGRDGARSMLSLRQYGAHTIAQNEETCAVYGMPKAAIDMNAAIEILPVDDIAISLLGTANGARSAGR
ncbi:MAG: chemotaxis response regulator protein-glutamate methylesterase [Gammaproteobacteria bacterium]|nr:chemotaxis response regulator protein-glutamate methylesterase [Gammaproteobacteria bacterium]